MKIQKIISILTLSLFLTACQSPNQSSELSTITEQLTHIVEQIETIQQENQSIKSEINTIKQTQEKINNTTHVTQIENKNTTKSETPSSKETQTPKSTQKFQNPTLIQEDKQKELRSSLTKNQQSTGKYRNIGSTVADINNITYFIYSTSQTEGEITNTLYAHNNTTKNTTKITSDTRSDYKVHNIKKIQGNKIITMLVHSDSTPWMCTAFWKSSKEEDGYRFEYLDTTKAQQEFLPYDVPQTLINEESVNVKKCIKNTQQ